MASSAVAVSPVTLRTSYCSSIDTRERDCQNRRALEGADGGERGVLEAFVRGKACDCGESFLAGIEDQNNALGGLICATLTTLRLLV